MARQFTRPSPRVWITLAALAALAALAVTYHFVFVRPEHAGEARQPEAPDRLLVSRLSGVVEVAGADGRYRPARLGLALELRDQLRCDDSGWVELRLADGSALRLLGGSTVRVEELRRELKRFHLFSGMIEADVTEDRRRLFEVVLDQDGATARTRSASFAASSNAMGTAAVASRRGDVILAARGKVVVIHTGEYARIAPGAPPEPPRPIPSALLLRVKWPPSASRSSRLPVEGTTAPGARVKVGGRYVPVDGEGNYRAEVTLPDGEHHLEVRASDVGGHFAEAESPRIVVDTQTDFKIQPVKWK